MYLLNIISFNYILEIDILRNYLERFGCPEGGFWEVWVSKGRLDALLVKTIYRVHIPQHLVTSHILLFISHLR